MPSLPLTDLPGPRGLSLKFGEVYGVNGSTRGISLLKTPTCRAWCFWRKLNSSELGGTRANALMSGLVCPLRWFAITLWGQPTLAVWRKTAVIDPRTYSGSALTCRDCVPHSLTVAVVYTPERRASSTRDDLPFFSSNSDTSTPPRKWRHRKEHCATVI